MATKSGGPIATSDAVWAAARKVARVPPSLWPEAVRELREALAEYDDLLQRMAAAFCEGRP